MATLEQLYAEFPLTLTVRGKPDRRGFHELTERQRRFVEEYLLHGNFVAAAIRAGYSKHSAHVLGRTVLKSRNVAREIARRRAGLEAADAHFATGEPMKRPAPQELAWALEQVRADGHIERHTAFVLAAEVLALRDELTRVETTPNQWEARHG